MNSRRFESCTASRSPGRARGGGARREPGGAIRDLAEGQLPAAAGAVTDQADGVGASAQGQVEEVAEQHGRL